MDRTITAAGKIQGQILNLVKVKLLENKLLKDTCTAPKYLLQDIC